MTVDGLRRSGPAPSASGPERGAGDGESGLTMAVSDAAAYSAAVALERLHSTAEGLTATEAARRLALVGPNAVRTHRAQPLAILGRQLRSAVLILLAVTAFISFFL